jgi:hypothetical protein
MKAGIIGLAILLCAGPANAEDWKLLGSYVKGGMRICTYQQGNATGTAVVAEGDECPAAPKS